MLTMDTNVLVSILFQISISPNANWQGGGHGSPAANLSVPEHQSSATVGVDPGTSAGP